MNHDTPAAASTPTRLGARSAIAVLVSTLSVLACGGGGPGVSGPEAQTLFADYSGSWILDEAVSDSVRTGPAGGRQGRGGADGRDPFGGTPDPFGGASGRGGGGGPPGGMSGGGGGRGGPGGGMRPGGRGASDPEAMEAMRHTLAAARQRPDRITLELDDSTFAVAQSPGGRTSVPIMGDEVELNRTAWPVIAKVEWDDGRPRLEREFENGGRIVDSFELVSRTRLIVTRKVEGGPGGDLELRFVYGREDSAGESR